MLYVLAFLFCIIAIIIFIIMVATSSHGKSVDNSSNNKHEYEHRTRADKMLERGELPAWDDLNDDEKTKLSVWSEKGEPLEDLHLFDK